ncbi:MAG: sigma-70 family RNA polymerase sigma factor [Ignavibacteria bacterium]|nr:sigma-70 family RNA polymerase sigma factor [Ignavibacteria bacterium]
MEDKELIELAKTGDRKALADLVRKYETTVYNFSYKICRDREKAENTMQETFLSMVKSINQFEGDSKLSTWLYRIVSNHCLMLARYTNKFQFVDVETEDSLFDDRFVVDSTKIPAKQFENEELKGILDSAIQKLAPEYRIVFMLRDVEQLSTEETAAATGLTVAAVKSRLHRARAFLRNEIETAFRN